MHLKTSVPYGDGEVLVSTILLGYGLPIPEGLAGVVGSMYETCVFFPNGDSEVVERYETAEEAIDAHRAYCRPAVINLVDRMLRAEYGDE